MVTYYYYIDVLYEITKLNSIEYNSYRVVTLVAAVIQPSYDNKCINKYTYNYIHIKRIFNKLPIKSQKKHTLYFV